MPQAILITGPQGVGKQRLGLWMAQRLFCSTRRSAGAPMDAEVEPCGECRECRLVLGLAHPDLHWMVPIPRPKAAEPDRASTGWASAKVPLTSLPGLLVLGSTTDRVASPAVEMTVAFVDEV